jgi:hypothetical protein
MTREEAVAEAKRRQASGPGAGWIAVSRDAEWTVVGIARPELSHLRSATNRAARSRGSSLSSRSGIWGGTPLGGV